MTMNQELAQIYGNVPDEETQKLASAQLAEGLQDEGSVTRNLTDEQIENLAKSMVGNGEEKTAAGEGGEGEAEEEGEGGGEAGDEGEGGANEELSEEQQKLAEADYLGRVMAHAFVAEQRDIFAEQEKVAMSP